MDRTQVGRVRVRWTLAVLLNSILPAFFGLSVVEGVGGYLGMGCGILAWWAVGWAVCRLHPRMMQSLFVGALVIGLLQVLGLPHIFAGIAAVGCWEGFEGLVGWRFPSAMTGFALTILTGGELLLAASVLGLLGPYSYLWEYPPASPVSPIGSDQ